MSAQASMETFEGKLAELPSSGAYILFKGVGGPIGFCSRQAQDYCRPVPLPWRRLVPPPCRLNTPSLASVPTSSSSLQHPSPALQLTGAQTVCAAPRQCGTLWQPRAAGCWRSTLRRRPQASLAKKAEKGPVGCVCPGRPVLFGGFLPRADLTSHLMRVDP